MATYFPIPLMNIYGVALTKNSTGNSLQDFHEKELYEKIL